MTAVFAALGSLGGPVAIVAACIVGFALTGPSVLYLYRRQTLELVDELEEHPEPTLALPATTTQMVGRNKIRRIHVVTLKQPGRPVFARTKRKLPQATYVLVYGRPEPGRAFAVVLPNRRIVICDNVKPGTWPPIRPDLLPSIHRMSHDNHTNRAQIT